MADNQGPTPPHKDFSALLIPAGSDSIQRPRKLESELESPGRSESPDTTTSTLTSMTRTGPIPVPVSELHHFTPRLPYRIPKLPRPPKKAKSPNGTECCMVITRTSTELLGIPGSKVFVDRSDISRPLVEKWKKRGVQLLLGYSISRSKLGGIMLDPPCSGQAGIVKDHRGRVSLYTALHNVSNFDKVVRNDDGELIQYYFKHYSVEAVMEGRIEGQLVRLKHQNFEESKARPLNIGKFSNWKQGWDVTTGPVVYMPPKKQSPWWNVKTFTCDKSPLYKPWEQQITNLDRSPEDIQEMMFETVRPKFPYRVGQLVAIVVSSVGMAETATPQKADSKWGPELTQDDCDRIYGPPGVISIYTGKVTKVGDHHLEYDINTYEGCSGAIVFLLESHDQLKSVLKGDFGKAIAVHVGYDSLLGSNIGLKISKGPSKPWGLRLPKL